MPLNHLDGEVIGDLGRTYRIAPLEKWRFTSLFETACKEAEISFVRRGALLPIRWQQDQVLVQEYPGSSKLVFVFCRPVAGTEYFYPYVFDLPPALVAELRATGKWPGVH